MLYLGLQSAKSDIGNLLCISGLIPFGIITCFHSSCLTLVVHYPGLINGSKDTFKTTLSYVIFLFTPFRNTQRYAHKLITGKNKRKGDYNMKIEWKVGYTLSSLDRFKVLNFILSVFP